MYLFSDLLGQERLDVMKLLYIGRCSFIFVFGSRVSLDKSHIYYPHRVIYLKWQPYPHSRCNLDQLFHLFKLYFAKLKHSECYCLTEFGIAGSAFLATLVYFPTKPPHPPSVTATVDRADFREGVMALLK